MINSGSARYPDSAEKIGNRVIRIGILIAIVIAMKNIQADIGRKFSIRGCSNFFDHGLIENKKSRSDWNKNQGLVDPDQNFNRDRDHDKKFNRIAVSKREFAR